MGGGNTTTSITDVPKEFKPSFTSLFNSAFGSARTAAGQEGFDTQFLGTPGFQGGAPSFQGGFTGQDFGLPLSGQTRLDSGINSPLSGGAKGGTAPPVPTGSLGATAPISPLSTGSTAQPAPDTTGGALAGPGVVLPGGTTTGGFNAPLTAAGGGGGKGGGAATPGGAEQVAPSLEEGFRSSGSKSVPLSGGFPVVAPAFGGPFNAAPTAQDFAALSLRQQVADQAANAGGGLFNTGQAQAAGSFLFPESNPFLQRTIDTAIRPVQEAFDRSRQQLSSQALQSGAFQGSSRRGLLENQLATDFQRNVGDTASTLAFQNLANERQLQQNAGTLIDQALSLQQLQPELLSQVGTGVRQINQLGIEEQLRQFEELLQAPFRSIIPLANIIQGANIGSVGSLTNQQAPGGFAGGIQGALGGAGIGGALGSQVGTDNTGLGAILGALGGGAAGAF